MHPFPCIDRRTPGRAEGSPGRFPGTVVRPRPTGRGLLLACLLVLASLATGHAQVDVTEKVRTHTPLGQKVREFCATYCQGNRREGRLLDATLKPLGKDRYHAVMTASLRNCQEMEDPLPMTLFDWTIRVRAQGVLDASTCTLVVDSVTVDHDPYGLVAEALGDPRGQKIQVAHCRRLLP